jgi:ankyrin repeat protein
LLLKAKAPVNGQDCDGNTPLHYAMTQRITGIVQTFCNYSVPLNMQNHAGQSIGHLAVYYRSTEMIKFLGNKKYNVNWNLADGNVLTPALIASQLGEPKCLKYC